MLKLERPLCFFDFETTGPNVEEDRIVEYAFIKISPDESEEVLSGLLNPGIPIPAAATEVHGIRDEMVENKPTFLQKAAEFANFMKGCDWAGHNINVFDVPLLKKEFERANFVIKMDGKVYLIDTCILDRKLRPHTLSVVFEDYTGTELKEAHGAEADTRAVKIILSKMFERHTDLPCKISELHNYVWELDKFVDMNHRFYYDSNGDAIFNFGKVKDRALSEIANYKRDYLEWMLGPSSTFSSEVKMIVKNALRGIFPKKKEEGGGYKWERIDN
jgi:DNA polymerase-3 subunit epsilon